MSEPLWYEEIRDLRAQLAELRKDYDDIRIALIEEREAFLSQCAAAELELRNLRQAALQTHDDTAMLDYLDMPWVKVAVFGHGEWISDMTEVHPSERHTCSPLTLRQWIDKQLSALPTPADGEDDDDDDPDPLAWVEDSPWAEEGKG